MAESISSIIQFLTDNKSDVVRGELQVAKLVLELKSKGVVVDFS